MDGDVGQDRSAIILAGARLQSGEVRLFTTCAIIDDTDPARFQPNRVENTLTVVLDDRSPILVHNHVYRVGRYAHQADDDSRVHLG